MTPTDCEPVRLWFLLESGRHPSLWRSGGTSASLATDEVRTTSALYCRQLRGTHDLKSSRGTVEPGLTSTNDSPHLHGKLSRQALKPGQEGTEFFRDTLVNQYLYQKTCVFFDKHMLETSSDNDRLATWTKRSANTASLTSWMEHRQRKHSGRCLEFASFNATRRPCSSSQSPRTSVLFCTASFLQFQCKNTRLQRCG